MLAHRLPHSAEPHSRILPQRGIAMKITGLKTNYQIDPMGIELEHITFTWTTEAARSRFSTKVRLVIGTDPALRHLVYDSDEAAVSDPAVRTALLRHAVNPEVTLLPGRPYYWRVAESGDAGEDAVSRVASFEGGHPAGGWAGQWIRPAFTADLHPVLRRTFDLSKADLARLQRSRLYIIGLGLYEAYLNGRKIGDQYLTPYFTDYRYWVQYQTYDVRALLREGENTLDVWLGNGWYKGRFGYLAGGQMRNYYGSEFALLADLCLWEQDGSLRTIGTDEQWISLKSPVVSSGIYDGEVLDGRKLDLFLSAEEDGPAENAEQGGERSAGSSCGEMRKPESREVSAVVLMEPGAAGRTGAGSAPDFTLRPMKGLPVTAHERRKPERILTTPRGEVVIDFGQEVTGWAEFRAAVPADAEIRLDYGEVLQDGCFYRDNLRSATASFVYISDGKKRAVRPHFTFYGFRYVRVSGMSAEEAGRADFTAVSLYSDMEETGDLLTGNEKVNRLIANTKWSEKDNFVDIPSDCPQRDERCGWTGDAQIFCGTASYHMETAAFFRKYLADMLAEQDEKDGAVPYVVPDVLTIGRQKMGEMPFDFAEDRWGEAGAAVWGDAATIIPWTMYQRFADTAWLREAYPNMKRWTDFVYTMDEEHCGGGRLWTCGFHFGDWLSLDVEGDAAGMENREGGTDKHYVASVYYMVSAALTAKAARVLGYAADADRYERLAGEVRSAVRRRYVTGNGTLAIGTQTAYALAIHFGILEEAEMPAAGERLAELVHAWKDHLATGFVGTAFICSALTQTGHVREAFTLLLNEDYPSWLYEVNMGATTVWERWNSILPDGHISGTGMNSLNHYAYGCIVQWLYEEVCGLNLEEPEAAAAKYAGTECGAGDCPPAARLFRFAPHTDLRLGEACARVRLSCGTARAGWKRTVETDGTQKVAYMFTVPYGCAATFTPDLPVKSVILETEDTDAAQPEDMLSTLTAGGAADSGRKNDGTDNGHRSRISAEQLRKMVFYRGNYRILAECSE